MRILDADHLDWIGKYNRWPRLKTTRNDDTRALLYMPSGTDCGHRNAKPTREAAVLGLLKYNRPSVVPCSRVDDCLVTASTWLDTMFAGVLDASCVLSIDDTIDELVLNTSPGFPWNKMYRNKREMLENVGRTPFYEYVDLLDTDVQWIAYWTSALKEELRPIEKLEKNSIRQINGASAEFTAAMNCYTLSQNDALYEMHTKSPSSVGMSPFHGGWDQLWRKLSRFSRGFDGDYVKFDSSLIERVLELVGLFRYRGLVKHFDLVGMSKTMRKVHTKRFWKLTMNEIHSLLVTIYGDLVIKHLGQPSGTPNTAASNTFVAVVLVCACWIFNGLGDINAFLVLVAPALYADDLAISVDESVIEVFNGNAVSEFVKLLGMDLEVDSVPVQVSELRFLSNGFGLFNGHGVAVPLNLDKLRSGIFFRSDGEICTQFCRLASYRALLYGGVLTKHTGCVKLYREVEHYGNVLRQKGDSLIGNTLQWKAAISQWKSEVELLHLHLNFESGTPDLKINDGTQEHHYANRAVVCSGSA